jgi:hypothetical protein
LSIVAEVAVGFYCKLMGVVWFAKNGFRIGLELVWACVFSIIVSGANHPIPSELRSLPSKSLLGSLRRGAFLFHFLNVVILKGSWQKGGKTFTIVYAIVL